MFLFDEVGISIYLYDHVQLVAVEVCDEVKYGFLTCEPISSLFVFEYLPKHGFGLGSVSA